MSPDTCQVVVIPQAHYRYPTQIRNAKRHTCMLFFTFRKVLDQSWNKLDISHHKNIGPSAAIYDFYSILIGFFILVSISPFRTNMGIYDNKIKIKNKRLLTAHIFVSFMPFLISLSRW